MENTEEIANKGCWALGQYPIHHKNHHFYKHNWKYHAQVFSKYTGKLSIKYNFPPKAVPV